MNKEKVIGLFQLAIGVLIFFCWLHPLFLPQFLSWRGSILPLQPFLVPLLAISQGWLNLHGQVPLHRKPHHSHVLAVGALLFIVVYLAVYLAMTTTASK